MDKHILLLELGEKTRIVRESDYSPAFVPGGEKQ